MLFINLWRGARSLTQLMNNRVSNYPRQINMNLPRNKRPAARQKRHEDGGRGGERETEGARHRQGKNTRTGARDRQGVWQGTRSDEKGKEQARNRQGVWQGTRTDEKASKEAGDGHGRK